MKITVYTINDCKFSQAEKEYLKKNNVEFEEKNLETNRDFLTEMLAVSNNFAGTPVTKIEKDSGEAIVLKGFTQEEFDKALGITSEGTSPTAQTAVVATASTEMQKEESTQTAAQTSGIPEGQIEETSPASVEAVSQPEAPTVNASSADVQQPTPTVVESLSEDDSSSVTPSNDMPVPPPVEPLTPVAPASADSIGPISLSDAPAAPATETPVETVPATDMNTANAQPTAEATPAPATQPSAAPQPANDALNSVLQNLESQVNSSAPAQDGQKQ